MTQFDSHGHEMFLREPPPHGHFASMPRGSAHGHSAAWLRHRRSPSDRSPDSRRSRRRAAPSSTNRVRSDRRTSRCTYARLSVVSRRSSPKMESKDAVGTCFCRLAAPPRIETRPTATDPKIVADSSWSRPTATALPGASPSNSGKSSWLAPVDPVHRARRSTSPVHRERGVRNRQPRPAFRASRHRSRTRSPSTTARPFASRR